MRDFIAFYLNFITFADRKIILGNQCQGYKNKVK